MNDYGKAWAIVAENIDYIKSDKSKIYIEDMKNHLVEKYIDEIEENGKEFKEKIITQYADNQGIKKKVWNKFYEYIR